MLDNRQTLNIQYVSGIIDGEGCIAFSLISKKYLRPRLVVHMCHSELIKLLHEQFGGSFGTIDRAGNRRIAYIWQVSGPTAIKIIRQIIPYLIVKKEQASCVLAFALLNNNADVEMNKFFKNKMHELNRRGTFA